MIRKDIVPFVLAALLVMGCDAHKEFPDTSLKVGHVLCTDGRTMSVDELARSGALPVAVVFHVNRDSTVRGDGYAVYLRDLSPAAFADTLGLPQKTSASLTALDGNENTYAMYSCKEVSSPAAGATFDMWSYGQSAYIPSVAQMRLLLFSLPEISPVLERLGGDPMLPCDGSLWYWTSTEVAGQESHKAWLYSMDSGAVQETPKNEPHRVRPILTLNR